MVKLMMDMVPMLRVPNVPGLLNLPGWYQEVPYGNLLPGHFSVKQYQKTSYRVCDCNQFEALIHFT